MFFNLDCGRSVAVDALYYQRTYLSLLEGLPTQEMNDRILDRVRSDYTKTSRSRPSRVESSRHGSRENEGAVPRRLDTAYRIPNQAR
jgi:hypothetical protein